jgi:hypothetical protein
VLPLGMWPECFAHTRGCAGAVLGGRRAAGRRAGAARPRPALPRWQALLATHCLGGRATGLGGGGRRDARRASRPARPGPPPPGPARHARPAPPLPAGRGGAPLPKGPPQPFAAAGGQGREGGGGPRGRGQGEALRLAGCAPGIRPAAGSGPGLTCSLSSAIESVQPGFRSDSLQNMHNML